MNPIKQLSGTITAIKDLSPTAREYTINPSEPFSFVAGAFVNVFFTHNGKTIRRAFSMSSSDQNESSFTISVRHNPDGELTPLLWSHDFTGREIRLMGPLGLNTANKMTSKKVYLFGFGIGAGVVKSLADHLVRRSDLENLTIVTGNRSTQEILYHEYFDTLAAHNPNVSTSYVVSEKYQSQYPVGYIQDHIKSYSFEQADVYICGQTTACKALQAAIQDKKPSNCRFFIEDFH